MSVVPNGLVGSGRLGRKRHRFLTPACPFRPMRNAHPADIVPLEGGGFSPTLMGGGRLRDMVEWDMAEGDMFA